MWVLLYGQVNPDVKKGLCAGKLVSFVSSYSSSI